MGVPPGRAARADAGLIPIATAARSSPRAPIAVRRSDTAACSRGSDPGALHHASVTLIAAVSGLPWTPTERFTVNDGLAWRSSSATPRSTADLPVVRRLDPRSAALALFDGAAYVDQARGEADVVHLERNEFVPAHPGAVVEPHGECPHRFAVLAIAAKNPASPRRSGATRGPRRPNAHPGSSVSSFNVVISAETHKRVESSPRRGRNGGAGIVVRDARATGEWQAIRKRVLLRDGYACQRCGSSNAGELDVHHRMPRSFRVDDSPANLITLCDGCHAGVHLNLQVSLGRRVIQRWAVRVARLVDWHHDLPAGDLNLGPVLAALGVERLRPRQLHVILAILAGWDVLSVRPTGSGKTICFQVPTLLRPGYALVIEPLRTLMKDQVGHLHDRSIPATFVSGEVLPQERRERYDLLRANGWKFFYLAPERFDRESVRSLEEQARLDEIRPSFFIVDEAHTIPQYGDGFRPAYAQVGAIRERVGRPPALAFTATANRKTQAAICAALGTADAEVIVEDPDRPNIALVRYPIGRDDPRRFLITKALLQTIDDGRAIIFVPTKKVGVAVQAGLAAVGLDLEFFHASAGTANWRDMLQRRFEGKLEPTVNAIIATSAFGMGLDIPDIRLIVNWQHPFSVEEYVQAVGRAGRDGNQSTAVLFTDQRNDRQLLSWMLDREPGENLSDRRRALDEMSQIAGRTDRCFRDQILRALDAPKRAKRPLSVRILEWAFSSRGSTQARQACCDHCSPQLVQPLRVAASTTPRRGRTP